MKTGFALLSSARSWRIRSDLARYFQQDWQCVSGFCSPNFSFHWALWNPIYMPFIRLQYLQRPRTFKNIECFFLHKILTKLHEKYRRNRRNHEGGWDAPLWLSLMWLLLLQRKYFNDTQTHKLLWRQRGGQVISSSAHRLSTFFFVVKESHVHRLICRENLVFINFQQLHTEHSTCWQANNSNILPRFHTQLYKTTVETDLPWQGMLM